MYYLNKIVSTLVNPTTIALLMIAVCAIRLIWGLRRAEERKLTRCRWARWGLVGGLCLLWIWSTPLMMRTLGLPLERMWLVDGRVPRVETFPECDAIHCLGGGMGGDTNVSDYAEMWSGADRVWQAARLYKAGKASRIFCSGCGNESTTKGLLMDLGVSTNALFFLEKPRNTEEEARTIVEVLGRGRTSERPKVLLVTSAWHMRRAKLMYEKYAPEVEIVPAPADFEATVYFARGFKWRELLPSGMYIVANEGYFKEWLGYYGYKWFR